MIFPLPNPIEPSRRLLSLTGRLCVVLIGLSVIVRPSMAQSRARYRALRLYMVHEFIEKEGVTHPAVLKSVRAVPRHLFVRPSDRNRAYWDGAMPIGYKQTISPPYIVCYMTQTIDPKPTDKVLEIGTGSGYQAAILSGIVKDVYTIEIVPQLGRTAAKRLKQLGYNNVHTKIGDGFKGWPQHAPFDKIIVTCSPENIPQPLIDQLKEGGKLLIPLGERYQQVFHLLEKKGGKLIQKKLIPTLFVPMTGISEDNRKVKPDSAHPKIINGSFEIDANKDGRTDNWHYQRQLTLETRGAPDGSHYIVLNNQRPGKLAQMLQGLALDGRRVRKIELSVRVKYERTAAGLNSHEKPGIMVHFFDVLRKPIGRKGIGPLVGTRRDWVTLRRIITIPSRAREAVIQIGLLGGTGQLSVDDIRITLIQR